MPERGKRYQQIKNKVDSTKRYDLEEGVRLIIETATARFNENMDIAIKLGVDPRKADQMVRGAVVLPHGIGKKIRILVFAKGEKEKEATEAGADYVGGEELAKKIQEGWLDFDKVIATPDMMGMVGKLGRILGPRGLMPNPKLGTVTFDVARAIQELKSGRIEFRVEKAGIIHSSVGRVSFGAEKLLDNIKALLDTVIRLKPATSKGIYLKGLALSSTMGPGVKIDPGLVRSLVK